MIQIETLMAVAGALLLVSVFANRISVFLGIPGLLIFIGIGMLAGSDGIVRIQFYDARMTNYIGTVALAFILFAGGLDTRWRDVRPVLAGGSLLATLGVVLTALFLFLPAYYVLRLELPVALLLGVIVSSTDAPAVFMIMRTQKAELRDNLRPCWSSNPPATIRWRFYFLWGRWLGCKTPILPLPVWPKCLFSNLLSALPPAADWDGWREFC